MFKVILWDYTGESANWAKNFLKDDVEIIRTLHSDDDDQAKVIMRGDWNFVLIFEQDQRELFNEIFKTMHEMNFSTNNIIFARDFYHWLNNPTAVYALLKPEMCDQIYRYWSYYNQRRWHKYHSVSVEGLHYVGTSIDNAIMWYMYINNKNFAADEMKIFHDLSKKYYRIDDSGGIFLDLGANIGTTGFYFLKKFAPNLKLLAFEPDAENFKLLRINAILNDMEDRATLVNCGLGDKFDELTMYRDLTNPGNDSLFKLDDNQPTETIKIIPLDSYLAENKIAAEEVKYMWIDAQGFEPQILFGAKNLLTKNSIPLFVEFNPLTWEQMGYFEPLMAFFSELYSHFVHVEFGNIKLYPLEALRTIEPSKEQYGTRGDIFLIKNLA